MVRLEVKKNKRKDKNGSDGLKDRERNIKVFNTIGTT